MNQDAPFTVPEADMALAIGLDRRCIRELRATNQDDFIEGRDWDLQNGKIHWRPEAAAAVIALLSPQNGSDHHPEPKNEPDPPAQAAAAPLIAPPEVLKVLSANFPNTRVLQCVRDQAQNGQLTERITVRVKDARLFRPGMRLMARPGLGSAWEFLGNPDRPGNGARYPRGPGRW